MQNWEEGWQNTRRFIYVYYKDGRLTLVHRQRWWEDAWQDERRSEAVFNDRGNVISVFEESSVEGELVFAARRLYYYETLTSVTAFQEISFEVQLFPNPTSDYLNIHFTEEKWSEKQVRIYDAMGKVVRLCLN